MQSSTSKTLTKSEGVIEPRFSQQALRDLEKIIEQSITSSINLCSQPAEARTEDHSYAKLNTAATCVKTRGKAATALIKRLRTEKNVNIYTHRLETPLIIATQLGAARFASLIIMRGADLDAQDERGYSALHYAVESTSVKMLRQLVECGANVNIQNNDGNTPLHLIVSANNCEMFKELSRIRALDTSIVNNDNVDPLTLAVMTNQLRIMSFLLNFNQGYDKQDAQGKTPLHWACMVAGPCVIHRLIDRSQENIQDMYGDTPLTLAIKGNNERAVDLLWNTRHFNLSTRDSNGNTTLHMVCHHPNKHMIQLIIEQTIDVNTPNAFGETPLHHACSANNVVAVEELRKYCVDRNARDSKQQTPLIVAACNNGTAAAKSLFLNEHFAALFKATNSEEETSNTDMSVDIRRTVFVDAADELGNTALHYCSIFDNVELATFLIEKGAKTSVINKNWDTPITILTRTPPETTSLIYKEVYEPLLRLQHRVSGSEFNEYFPDQDPINIEDDVLP